MANIMDVINKYRGKTAQAAGQTGETVAAGGSGAVRQNMQLQAAQSIQNRAIVKEAGDSAAQSTVMEEQRKQANLQRDNEIVKIGQQGRAERQQYQAKAASTTNYLEQNLDKLGQAEKLDQMETAAGYLRLQDDKYRYQIADVGRRQRLDNAKSFDFALQQAIFKDEAKVLQESLDFSHMMALNDKDFRIYLSNIDIDVAMKMSKSATESAAETSQISGYGTIATSIASGVSSGLAGKGK